MHIIMVFFGFLLAGCASEKFSEEVVVAEVTDVRVTSVIEVQVGESGHPVVGAIVGGVIANVPGAIAGAAVGSGDDKLLKVREEILGCKFFAKTVNISMVFEILHGGEDKTSCSLLRKGDKTHLTGLRDSGGKIVAYRWRERYVTEYH